MDFNEEIYAEMALRIDWKKLFEFAVYSRFAMWFEREFQLPFSQLWLGDDDVIEYVAEKMSAPHRGDQALGLLVQEFAFQTRTGDFDTADLVSDLIMALLMMDIFKPLFKKHPDIKESFMYNYGHWVRQATMSVTKNYE